MADLRIAILASRGIEGSDAMASLAVIDRSLGTKRAHDALAAAFGQDAARTALALIAGPKS